jgi:hypothetical protein
MLSINNWTDRFFKIILIMGFFFILITLTILRSVEPAVSYEFSIYDAFPWYFWVFLFSAILCGQVGIIGSAITRSEKNYWFYGLCAILVSNVLLLFLPVIRGYFIFGDGDVLTHIGFMKDILQTSYIGENQYPVDHILGVIIHLSSGLSLTDITFIIPPLFSFFFILTMYFVGKTIFPNKFERLILLLLSTIVFFRDFHVAFTPNSQAIFFVPLILYLAFKIYYGVNYNKYYILILLISSLLVFYHPLVAIMVILILFLMEIIQIILKKYQTTFQKKVNYSYIIVFMLIVFSIWSSYLVTMIWVVKPIILRIFGDESVRSELQNNFDVLSRVAIDPFYLFNLILNIYGQWIVLGILSLLALGLTLKSVRDRKTDLNFYKGISIVGFIVFSILSAAIFLMINNFGFGRIFSFAIIFSLLLIPTGVYLFLNNNSHEGALSGIKIIKLLGVILVFFCLTYFSLFNLYYSPIIKETNVQVPESSYYGMSTFFSVRDDSLPVFELGPVTFRYYDALFGVSAKRLNIEYETKNMLPPEHFGYQNETLSADFYGNSKYLVMNDKGTDFYPHMYPEFKNNWRFLPEDFERLKSDRKVQQIFSSKNFEIFKI